MLATKSTIYAAITAIAIGAIVLAWTRAPALMVDLSTSLAAVFCL